jgi:hypothetical protein
MKTMLLVSFLLTTKAMTTPDTLLFLLFERDPAAALHFCAERPALHAAKGAAAASDVDLTCEEVIDGNFDAALHMPTMRDLGPSMIGALEKSPMRAHLAKPYAGLYRKLTSK